MSRLAHLRDALTYGLARPCDRCAAAEAIEGDRHCGDCHAELCAAPPALSPRLVAHWSHAPTVTLLRRAAGHYPALVAVACVIALHALAGDDVRDLYDDRSAEAAQAQDAAMTAQAQGDAASREVAS